MNCTVESRIECAWCGREIAWDGETFPTYFKATGTEAIKTGWVHISVPSKRRVVALLAPRPQSGAGRIGADLVALCCSARCQDELEKVWLTEREPELALN